MPRRIAIVGGGISGLGAAWALHHHPDRFDFRLFEAQEQIGGNAVTVDMPQDDGSSIPFDISVTACIPSVYNHILLLMENGIELDTRFNYSVRYGGSVYAHDFDSDIREQLQSEIAKFQRVLKRLHRITVQVAERPQSIQLHQHAGRSCWEDFPFTRKPMFINFVLATNVFDLPVFQLRPLVGPGNAAHLREPVGQLSDICKGALHHRGRGPGPTFDEVVFAAV